MAADLTDLGAGPGCSWRYITVRANHHFGEPDRDLPGCLRMRARVLVHAAGVPRAPPRRRRGDRRACASAHCGYWDGPVRGGLAIGAQGVWTPNRRGRRILDYV